MPPLSLSLSSSPSSPSKEPSQQRVKKWGFSLEEALKDPAGQELFLKFLESEFSSENLRWAREMASKVIANIFMLWFVFFVLLRSLFFKWEIKKKQKTNKQTNKKHVAPSGGAFDIYGFVNTFKEK